MNPNDYDFWSVGNEQLSLQNHFPKHIPKISLLSHSGADSPTDSNSVNNNYTCAEPEILRRSLESAIQSAHDEIEKYQFTLNANTAKKLLEATAQGAFRDDPNIQNSQNNHYQQQQQSRNYKKSKLRLMELFIPPIQEEEACELSSTPQNQSRRESEETNKNILKNSSSYKMEKRNSTPSILSSSMFQPPTPSENKKPPLYMNNSQKPPIVPNKKNENKYGEEDEEEEELQNKIISDNTNTKNNTDNEQSVTTIKSNVNDELLQLLNKYYPTKNKSQQNLNTDDEISSVEDSSERVYKSDGNIKVSNGSVISEGYKSSSESSSDTEKENIMEDSFLPSNANKKPHKSSNENVDHSNENNDKHSHSTLNDTSKEHSKTESQPSQSSKSKLRKKSKKHKLKEIFLPIQRIFNNNSNQNSSKKTKSNENIHKDSQSESYANDTNEDESKYRCEEVLGKGANAVVKLAKSSYTGNIKNLDNEKFYAIKQFRKRRRNEPYKSYIKKVISEFCISSSLKHQNVVETVDLIQDKNENWCEVMEYCSGGDLYTRINTGTLTNKDEINCYFKQLLTGVAYLHSVGVCHRDLKPENLLMDETGTILKITDFGVSEVFRFPWEKNVIKRVSGLCGSEPYIAPEEWSEDKDYDPIKVDIWACAIVFYTMNHMSVPWRQANSSDKYYEYYLSHITNFGPIEELPQITHETLYHMLDPNPETRWSMEKIIESDWIQGITACGGEAYKGKGNNVTGNCHEHTSKWKV